MPDPFYPDSAAFATIPRADLAAFLRHRAKYILVLGHVVMRPLRASGKELLLYPS